MKLIFEKGAPGRHLDLLPQPDVPEITLDETWSRKEPPKLPQLSETEIATIPSWQGGPGASTADFTPWAPAP